MHPGLAELDRLLDARIRSLFLTDPELTPRDRARGLALGAKVIADDTTRVFTDGLLRLQRRH